ncbi:hypothetical protein N7486_010983 [Penicillium sp. IBT 16267x]|nr:hypothetical protein N7486_010983 [Penicillium sp. IBT 16267x]
MDFSQDYVQIINGKSAPTEQTRHGVNPANKQALPPVPVATQQDLDNAVAAGKAAFETWSRTPFEERQKATIAYADAVEAHSAALVELLTREQGRPTEQAWMEVGGAPEWIRGLASIPLPDEVIEDNEQHTVVNRNTPLGVVAAIVPWNFPIRLAVGKIAPAVLTGNVVIVKPSPFTPYCGLKLVELAQQFFPPGVVQSLSGDDNLGPWITSHPGIDKINFTGSTATGKKVVQSASQTLKRVTLELGGNDPAIILPDVNVEKVADQIATFAFLNTGQICLNIKRIYVHESIYDKFKEAMVKSVDGYVVGDGSQPTTTHGPIQNAMQYARVKTFFDDIEVQGWKAVAGGKIEESAGYFIHPTIIDNPPEDSRIVVEEPFGPIVPLLKWSDEKDVIERANNTVNGLGASVWGKDLDRAGKVAKQLQAGTVWVNTHFELSPLAPFGGHKESGLGSEWGVDGMKAHCNAQVLFFKKTAA